MVQSTIVFLAIGLLTLLGIVATTIWLGEQAQIYSNEAYASRETQIAAVELRSALQSAKSSQRGYLVSGNEIYLAFYDNAKANTRRYLDRLVSTLPRRLETGAMLDRLSQIVEDKLSEMDTTNKLKSES